MCPVIVISIADRTPNKSASFSLAAIIGIAKSRFYSVKWCCLWCWFEFITSRGKRAGTIIGQFVSIGEMHCGDGRCARWAALRGCECSRCWVWVRIKYMRMWSARDNTESKNWQWPASLLEAMKFVWFLLIGRSENTYSSQPEKVPV